MQDNILGYGRIALILVEPHLGSKKVFQQKYHTFTDLLSG